LTGLIVVVAVIRLLLRGLLGLQRHGRLWLDNGVVYLDSSRKLLGREVSRTRRAFGPEALVTVVRETRFPNLYTYVGLLALCVGVLVGTTTYLDGRLAGLEDWMRTGVLLVLGGLGIDFGLSVLAGHRPGRTSLSVTFKRGGTVRLAGLDEDDADRFLRRLAEVTHAEAG
jgi:hypothetical protein